ncbi:hypothetical protein [Bradyrhizobium diazoefficiens]|nr:hypothetical protein XF15B_24080 [Bradyrhizobium diazoefficiens]
MTRTSFIVALFSIMATVIHAQTLSPPFAPNVGKFPGIRRPDGAGIPIPRPMSTTSPGGFLQLIRPDMSGSEFAAVAAKQFSKLDGDHDGVLTDRDVPLLREAGDLAKYQLLKREFDQMDANHDGVLTNEEIQGFYADRYKQIEDRMASARWSGEDTPERRRQVGQLKDMYATNLRVRVREFLALDVNRDGRVDLDELRAGMWLEIGPAYVETGDILTEQLAQARSITGTTLQDVSKDSYTTSANDYFRKIDTDQDGKLSRAEVSAERGVLADAGCNIPKPSSDAQIVILLGNAPLISNVAVGNLRSEGSAARLLVEGGSNPLYVIALPPPHLSAGPGNEIGHSMIWSVEGKSDRLEHFVVADPTGVGVSGLQPNRVTFLRSNWCFARPIETLLAQNEAAKASNAERLSKMGISAPISYVDYQHNALATALPSGQSQGSLPKLSWEDPTSWPPVVGLDPAEVLSLEKVVPYPSTPGFAGIGKLLKEGKITYELGSYADFVVRREFEFPPGISIAKFSVPAGGPIPHGDPGNACVFSMEANDYIGRTVRKCTPFPQESKNNRLE